MDRFVLFVRFFDDCLVAAITRLINKIKLLIPDLDPVAMLQATVRLAISIDENTVSTVAVNDEIFAPADPIWAGFGDDIRMVAANG